MGSLEEIYWNMVKSNGKLEHIMLSCPHNDGNYLINNALYMSASSLCSHNMPSCSHMSYSCVLSYILLFVRKINYL